MNDVIKPLHSPYNSPVWIVPKKPDSNEWWQWKIANDRFLCTEWENNRRRILSSQYYEDIGSSRKIFYVCSLASFTKYRCIEAQKTAFFTAYEYYHFNMPFELKNVSATFQRLIDQVLSGLQGIDIFVYLDIVIYAFSLNSNTSRNLINLQNDYDRRIFSYNQTNASSCERK